MASMAQQESDALSFDEVHDYLHNLAPDGKPWGMRADGSFWRKDMKEEDAPLLGDGYQQLEAPILGLEDASAKNTGVLAAGAEAFFSTQPRPPALPPTKRERAMQAFDGRRHSTTGPCVGRSSRLRSPSCPPPKRHRITVVPSTLPPGLYGGNSGSGAASSCDWQCPDSRCINHIRLVFTRKTICPKCGTPKPTAALSADAAAPGFTTSTGVPFF